MFSGESRSLRKDQRGALQDLLIGALSAYGRNDVDIDLERLVAAAPIENVPAAARLHRVSGGVYDVLCNVPGVPGGVLARLDQRRRVVARRHLMAATALRSILEEFDSAEISWLVMKGPVLTSSFYDGPGDREYGDLDLLVSAVDLAQAVRLLEKLGFTHQIQNWPLAEWFMASEFVMRSSLVDVDLHWHLIYADVERERFEVDPLELLGRARHVDVAGMPVPSFEPADMLLHLAFHAARSGAHRLIWLKDIERCLTIAGPDVRTVVDRARRFGCGPSVAIALDRARLVGAQVPEEVLVELAGWPLLAAERTVRRMSGPVRLHERDTIARFVARSVHGSLSATLLAAGPRAWRAARRRLDPVPAHETGDAKERTAFLDAVARS